MVSITKHELLFKKMLVFFTDPNQNWCTIRVDVSENAVTCPGSELALKVKVLKKAADLAAKERTTVRIPISTQGEVKNFGVYAVPGLETHVFVGPFTSKKCGPFLSITSKRSINMDLFLRIKLVDQ